MSTPARLVLHQNKTWAENAIEHWLAMETSDESAALLTEIMRERAKEVRATGPRRLRPGMVQLRRIESKERRMSRIKAAQFRQYYREGNLWPFTKADESTQASTAGHAQGDKT